MLSATRKVLNQAVRFSQEVARGAKRSADPLKQALLEAWRRDLEKMIPRVRQVIRQTRARIFGGTTHYPDKIVSLFEPTTEIIRKGKAGKPVQLQEAESQVITHYQVCARRPSDSDLLLPAVEMHQRQLGRLPRFVAADAGFYWLPNEQTIQQMGVNYVSVPNLSTRSEERRCQKKERWFRHAQRWRTGCEGRISLLKRRHGLNRCRYLGFDGMQRWGGLGVIANNLINMDRFLAAQTS